MISKIVNEILTSAHDEFQVVDGISFDYEDVIKRINLYINNQYQDRNDGIFWNISNSRIVHFAKNIDLDTKDLQPYADGEVAYVQTWILKMKFYKWLQDNHFALTLNARSVKLATYGSNIWKVTNNDISSPNLLNMYFNLKQDRIRDDKVAVEQHFLNEHQIRKKSWDNKDALLEKTPDEDNGDYKIWEYWGYNDDNEYGQWIGHGNGDSEIILFEKMQKEENFPYYDDHIDEYAGRWLRVGVPERLFHLQVRANQLVNQNAQASEIASLLLLRTANPEMLGNVLQDVENGEVINSDDLEQIGITNTGLNQFIAELQSIETKADELCLTPQVITGEALPSGTTFRGQAATTNAAKSAFTIPRENIGENTGYILKEKIFPGIVKDWNKGEILELGRDEADIKYFDKQMRRLMKRNTFTENLLNGRAVTMEELEELDQVIVEELDESPKRIKIPKNFFNFDFHIRTNITGESVDKAQRNDALFNTLTWVQSNPAIVDIPYFRQYCQENGIDYWRLTGEEKKALMAQTQMAGATPQEPIGQSQDKLSAQIDT